MTTQPSEGGNTPISTEQLLRQLLKAPTLVDTAAHSILNTLSPEEKGEFEKLMRADDERAAKEILERHISPTQLMILEVFGSKQEGDAPNMKFTTTPPKRFTNVPNPLNIKFDQK
jgi:hypothetical protein